MGKIDAILIAGPTASGKSAFAIEQAQKNNGIIVNSDSMQVYKELRVLTARPSIEDEAVVPHCMYGNVSGATAYSVGQWYEDVKLVLEDCRQSGTVPVFTGGTGMYFSALLGGLSPVPPVPDDIREYWRKQALEVGAPVLHKMLQERDPLMAGQLRPSDPQRLARALEVFDATGISLCEWQKKPGVPLIDEAKVEKYVISPERDMLYDRCNRRFDIMIEQGALKEVEELSARNFHPDLPIMRALGVKPIQDYLSGKMSLEEVAEISKRDTRRYAKRQLTWLRGNMIAWNWM
ncbi:MAG: tRNA (adenosine(37)-N6)-dimethylallyltransferase MiaA [Methyloligellaceae bacterium]